ncbi:hypothetical protein [Foetidibacter luteolus]|uniref:hypothetical protein n=1 Tax=Foetidibacter luteolus TaxID=2608880 RepID=UPI00129B5975|nr:hypothetical protein [Foetidibacter luteolus]
MKLRCTLKKAVAVLFPFLISSHQLVAQDFEIQLSEKLESQSKFFNAGAFVKALPAYDGSFIAMFTKPSKKRSGPDEIYTLMSFDGKLQADKEKDLDDLFSKDGDLLDFVRIENKYYLLTREVQWKEKTISVYAHSLDPVTLTMGNPHTVASFDISNDEANIDAVRSGGSVPDMFNVGIIYSRDSIKLGLYHFPRAKKKKMPKTMEFYVFDKQLAKITYKNFDFSVPESKIDVNSIDVDMEGRAYVYYDLYEEKDTKDFKREDGEKVPSYSSHLKVFNGDNYKDILIENDRHYIKKIIVGYDAADKVILYGLYKNLHKGNYAGICRSDLGNGDKSSFSYTEFPQELLDKLDRLGEAKNDGNKKGIVINFVIRQGITTNLGNTHIILECIKNADVSSSGRPLVKRTYSSLLVATFKANGVTTFTCIPKKQIGFFSPGYGTVYYSHSPIKLYLYSFESAYFEDRLLLFYNDDEDNLTLEEDEKPDAAKKVKKLVFTCAILSHDGKLLEKKIAMHSKDYDGFITGSDFFEIGPDKYAIFAFKTGFYKYSAKLGTLTIK